MLCDLHKVNQQTNGTGFQVTNLTARQIVQPGVLEQPLPHPLDELLIHTETGLGLG